MEERTERPPEIDGAAILALIRTLQRNGHANFFMDGHMDLDPNFRESLTTLLQLQDYGELDPTGKMTFRPEAVTALQRASTEEQTQSRQRFADNELERYDRLAAGYVNPQFDEHTTKIEESRIPNAIHRVLENIGAEIPDGEEAQKAALQAILSDPEKREALRQRLIENNS